MRGNVFNLCALLLLACTAVALGYDLGAQRCAQPPELAELDMMLGLLWRLLPLIAACGLLMYGGSLLWLDYVRRSWAILPSLHLPTQEGVPTPSGKVGKP